jgi:protein O-GlcNAc transferase
MDHEPQALAVQVGMSAAAIALIERGNQLEDAGDLAGAHHHYVEALALAPRLARAHLNCGNALLAMGESQRALEAFETAVAIDPGYAAAHYNAGNAYSRLRDPRAAVASYLRAVSLKPDLVDAYVALGNAQESLLLSADAETSYRRALQLRPGYSQVSYNLGCVLMEQKRWPEALSLFKDAEAGQYLPAVAQVCFCASQLCDWREREAQESAVAALIRAGSASIAPFPLLNMSSMHDQAAQLQLRAAQRFAQDQLRATPQTAQLPRAGSRLEGRLRIGYLSADLREHAVMHLLRGVLAAHDRKAFLVHAYSYGRVADALTDEARRTCEVFRDIKDLSDVDAAQTIARDGIDILVDLTGFTQDGRIEIPGLRPAPLLVSWLGYPGTLGHGRLADYLIGDAIVTPPANAGDFSETLALMPVCYQPNDRARAIGGNPGRAAAGLPQQGFVFCSFNQSFKFNPESFDVWCKLLHEVPGSVLWLLAAPAPVMDNLRREAQARGVESSRLIFAHRAPLGDHLGRMQLAGLALDTFPYNSHTTASDALWAGVPLVTLKGKTFASRVAASLLNAAGLPELSTTSWDEYFTLAKALALDAPRLEALRKRLLENRLSCPLFDTERFTRDLERLYLRMWEQHQAGTRRLVQLESESGADLAQSR